MSSDVILKVESLGKRYEIYSSTKYRLLQLIFQEKRKYFREFWALRDVSFQLRRGETVGIIGLNGSGKSTLLQLICGTLNPSEGNIQTNAKISALLELGAGFNGEFTGRENIIMSCALQGMKQKEIENKLPIIEEFAGIGDYIDQPVKFYSSGMFARLAFSSAIHVNPDLLIVDEALSVGDMAFQEKSITRMKHLRESGTSILYVSHSITSVRNFCDKALWLERGQVRAFGERIAVCDEYQREVERMVDHALPYQETSNHYISHDDSIDSERSLKVLSISTDKPRYAMADDIRIEVQLKFSNRPVTYGIGIIIYDERGNLVSILNTLRDDILGTETKTHWSLLIKNHHLAPGAYFITASIPDADAMFSFDRIDQCIKFHVEIERNSKGLAKVEGIIRLDHQWR